MSTVWALTPAFATPATHWPPWETRRSAKVSQTCLGPGMAIGQYLLARPYSGVEEEAGTQSVTAGEYQSHGKADSTLALIWEQAELVLGPQGGRGIQKMAIFARPQGIVWLESRRGQRHGW